MFGLLSMFSEAVRTDRHSSFRDLLSPPGTYRPSKLDNLGLMTALLDFNVMEALSTSVGAHSSQCSTERKLFTLLRYIDIHVAIVYDRNYEHRLV